MQLFTAFIKILFFRDKINISIEIFRVEETFYRRCERIIFNNEALIQS